MAYLFEFTVGPVQSFIAQARKLQDLYAGSFLLSYITSCLMKQIQKYEHITIIFPDSNSVSPPNRFVLKLNLATDDEVKNFGESLTCEAKKTLKNISEEVMNNRDLVPNKEFRDQIASLLECYWAAVPYHNNENYIDAYQNLMKQMSITKNARLFEPLSEPAGRKCNLSWEHNALFYRSKSQSARKAYCRGTYNLEEKNWSGIDKYLQYDETLGAVAFVKRNLVKAVPSFNDSFPSVIHIAVKSQLEQLREKEKEASCSKDIDILLNNKTEALFARNLDDYKTERKPVENIRELAKKHGIHLTPYYALVQFDGDDMGNRYGNDDIKEEEQREAFHTYLSKKLCEFAQNTVRSEVDWKKHNGVVIYAGGEDFMGALNLSSVFSVIQKLHDDFCAIDITNYSDRRLSLSAGIVIADFRTPLSEAINWVRRSEEKAKNYRHKPGQKYADKDAYCLTVLRHSGEINHFSYPFTFGKTTHTDGLGAVEDIIQTLATHRMSTSFIYQLTDEFRDILENSETGSSAIVMKNMLMTEVKRILLRSEAFQPRKEKENAVLRIMNAIEKLCDACGGDLSMILEFLCAIAFISRERGAKK